MIPQELRSRIRRLFFAEHWKFGTIAAELGVHRDTVELAIEPKRFVNVSCRPSALLLDPYKDFVRATLDQYPRLRSTRLLEMICQRGYTGSVWPLRRYVYRIRPVSKHEAFFRLSTLPGEQGQVDWGSFGSVSIGNTRRALSCFVMVLSWSRAIFARFVLDQTLESFLRCHVAAFAAFGGVVRGVLYDNLKTAVLERSGDANRFHPRLLELCGHYHFAPHPVAIARGNEKGRVERAIRYLRDSFFAARLFRSVDNLNHQLDEWIESVALARIVPGDPQKRTVRAAFAEERARLLPLPAHPICCDYVHGVASGKSPYIRFDCNDYSLPHTLVLRKPVTIVASDTLIRLLDGDTEVARHARCWERGRQIEDPRHLDGLADDKRHAREHRGRNRLMAACPSTEAFLQEVALHGGHLGGTTTRLLHLLDQYGAAALDTALAEAYRRGAFAAQSVAHVLDQHRRASGAPVPVNVVLPDDPRVRDQVVGSRSLAVYDALGRTQKDGTGGDDLSDLRSQLRALGLLTTAATLDDLVALATKKRWGLTEALEYIVEHEERDRARRGLERRTSRSRLEKFKPMSDFEWDWPTKIDRPLIESLLMLDFVEGARNVVLVAPGGLGKTMIAQNIAHRAILAGHSVLFVSAAQLLLDLGAQESARALERRLRYYAKIGLLVLDELGFLAFDNRNADLLFQVVSRRYQTQVSPFKQPLHLGRAPHFLNARAVDVSC